MKYRKGIEDLRRIRKEMEEGLIEKLEATRKEDEKFRDNDLRCRVSAARFLINDIVPKITRITIDLGLSKEVVMPKDITIEEMEKLFQSMPTLYTTWALTFKRDIQTNRKIEKNDLNDIAALSIAIPYCDIIVTENLWTSLSHQAKLDKIYSKIILSSVKDLYKHLQ